MGKYRVILMKQDVIDNMKSATNIEKVRQDILDNPNNIEWIKKYSNDEDPFISTNYIVDDFNLKIPEKIGCSCDVENAQILYKTFSNKIPRSILADERFWVALIFSKCYQYAQKSMNVNDKLYLKNHVFFGNESRRRTLFFNLLSRMYYYAELTYLENEEDPFKLLKFGYFENTQTLIREIFWRSYSSNKNISIAYLKAALRLYEETHVKPNNSNEISYMVKYISRLGSVCLIDHFTTEEIEEKVYNEILKYRAQMK